MCPVLALVFLMAVPVRAGQSATVTDKKISRTRGVTKPVTEVTKTVAVDTEVTDKTTTPVENNTVNAGVVAQSAVADDKAKNIDMHEIEALRAVTVDSIDKVPSNFGLWWRGVRETLSLALTWDELSKAQKALKFAEERMRIAQLIAQQQPDDAKAQEKAQKMIEKAQKFIDKVEAKKDKWNKAGSKEEVEILVGDIATYQSNADVILDEIEKDLSQGDMTAIGDLREKGAGVGSRLLNAIANENISAETKAHLEEVKARIEAHAAEVKAYDTEKKALQAKLQLGDVSAKADLEALKEARQTQIQLRTEGVGEIKTKLEEKANAGDEAAKRKLDIINKIQGIQTQEEGAAQENLQATTGSGSNDNVAAQDGEVQELSEKIKAVLEERNKASEEAAAAAAILGENKMDKQSGQ